MMRLVLLLVFTFSMSWSRVVPAADRVDAYLPLLQGKKVALVVNHSSRVGNKHLVDFLLQKGIKITKIFAPEHGFRGRADAGSHVKNSRDSRTNLPIISLYGKHKKPTKSDLKGTDILLFDIQDVGVRFYTYLSTLHYVIEAAAQNNKPLILLDRPNPNGHYIDGPILESKQRSFVGLDPVPLVYGMTIGEYARMLNGEGWIRGKAKLTVIPIAGYRHSSSYSLPIKPSPNLPNDRAIALYPSLAFFEGTVFSAGRGTTKPFELYGHPSYRSKKFSFVPQSRVGAKYPKFQNKKCYGIDLSQKSLKSIRAKKQIELSYLQDAYANFPNKKQFFLKNNFMDKLAGTDKLRKQILSGLSEAKIRASWQRDLDKFRKIRMKYLIYP
jgi:uncharacterized protein YbbC (DUF1343 family)